MKQSHSGMLPQITVMNAFLCLFVVMIHLTFAPLSNLIPKSLPHIIIFIINKSLCFCVPAFIFLSGFKLYKSYTKRPLIIKSFFKRRLKKIVLPYFTAILVYVFYFGAKGWLSENLFQYLILGTISAHFYYIVVLVQLYLLFPLIFRLFTKHSRSITAFSALVTLLCVIFLQTGYWDRFFGTYIFYFVFGMFWAKYDLYNIFKKSLTKIYLAYFVFFIIHMVKLCLLEYDGVPYRTFHVINIIYVTLAIFAFYGLSEEFLSRFEHIISVSRIISDCSYSIYLYHLLVIFILQYDILPRYSLSVKWNFFLTTSVVYSVIAIYCMIIRRSKRRKIK